jgi:hypothetical protein
MTGIPATSDPQKIGCMANTIAPHERAQTDSAMGPMRKGGMRFASASDRVSVGFTRSPAEHDRIASLLPFNFDYGGVPNK